MTALPECLEVVRGHASVRAYLDEALPEEHVRAIVEAARRAPSSWGLQPVTVTAVLDPSKRRAIAEAVGGQEHVARAPLFLVYSVDYNKLLEAARLFKVDPAEPGLGHFTVAVIDASIAAAWSALVAESLGYGTVFIAVYAAACRVAEVLGLPRRVVPVLGLCVGKPAERPAPRPRQDPDLFASRDGYIPLDGEAVKRLAGVLGEKAKKVYTTVLPRGGFYERVGRELAECLRERGFRL